MLAMTQARHWLTMAHILARQSVAPGRAHQTDTMHLESVVDDTGGTVVVSGSENGSILMWDGDLIEDRVSTWRSRLSSPNNTRSVCSVC